MRKMLTFTLSHYLHVLINWAATAMAGGKFEQNLHLFSESRHLMEYFDAY